MIRVAVTGGRKYHDERRVCDVLNEIHAERPISTLMHGGQSGADEAAAFWALTLKEVPCVITFPALWKTDGGKAAGPRRNRRMLTEGKPDLVVAFPGGKGTANCVAIARELGIEVLTIDN